MPDTSEIARKKMRAWSYVGKQLRNELFFSKMLDFIVTMFGQVDVPDPTLSPANRTRSNE